ncbi:MAG: DUF4856 domain-containing protein [Bacteroidetes bacterium]|nr:DUF4856 domain-containing protein [Bacteroidota bacterium]
MKNLRHFKPQSLLILALALALSACEDNDSDTDPNTYTIPDTYTFSDDEGNNTVSYQGQIDRLNQLSEMNDLMDEATTGTIDAQDLKDMYANTGDDGNGNFSFTSSKQLKNKTFGAGVDASTQEMFENFMDSLAANSESFDQTAAEGVAGIASSGSGNYLVSANGIEYKQLIEKGLMGAVFYYQAVSYYLSDAKIGEGVDNESPSDPEAGKYYTAMEHHWDEAFGYFGVPVDFPATLTDRFWGKYTNSRDEAGLMSYDKSVNNAMMDAFIAGRAAVSNDDTDAKNENIRIIRETWELISAAQAIDYFEGAQANFGSDNAKFLHELSEAWAFTNTLKYSPEETRKITNEKVDHILNDVIGDNFWEVTSQDLSDAIDEIKTVYGL